jgi:HEAT repeat protein
MAVLGALPLFVLSKFLSHSFGVSHSSFLLHHRLEITMRKRWPIGIVIVIVGLLGLAWLFPTLVYIPVGIVKGQATFEGKPTGYWEAAFNQEGFLGRSPPPGDAGKTLREGGAAAVPVLIEMARGPDENLRANALSTLNLMGPEAKDAMPLFKEVLQSEKNASRFLLAGRSMAKVDPAAAGEALAAVLREKDPDFSRRAWAFTILLEMSPKGQEALPAAKEIYDDPKTHPVLRVQAIDELFHLGQPVEPMIPVLCDMVKDEKGPAAVQALMVLGTMGSAAKSAVPVLLEVLKRPSLPLIGNTWGPANRGMVFRTLGQIGPEAGAAIPVLLAWLNNDGYFKPRTLKGQHFLRMEVGQALANMGPEAKKAVMTRDIVWGTSIALLAAQSPGNITTVPLVVYEKRTWVPHDQKINIEVRKAIVKMDPNADIRAGLIPLNALDFLQGDP